VNTKQHTTKPFLSPVTVNLLDKYMNMQFAAKTLLTARCYA